MHCSHAPALGVVEDMWIEANFNDQCCMHPITDFVSTIQKSSSNHLLPGYIPFCFNAHSIRCPSLTCLGTIILPREACPTGVPDLLRDSKVSY